jgi:FSR family fosmidomycin resistance protein-like MFS transporter
MNAARLTLVFAGLGHALFHIIVALFITLVLVLAPLWGRPYEELIGLWTLGALMLGLGAPVAGWVGDRFGEIRVMLIFFAGIGVASIGCGLADGAGELTLWLTVMGLFGAIYHPVGTAWVVKNVARRGQSIALVGIAGSIGAAIASTVAGGLADLASWRVAFILPGVLALLAGAALALCWLLGLVADRASDAAPEPEPARLDVRRAFAVLIVTMSLTSLAYHAFSTMLPKWVERELWAGAPASLTAVGAVVTLIYLLGATAQFIGGHYADRGMAKTVYAASFALKLAALVAASMVGGWPMLIAAVVVVFVFDIAAPVENVLIARYTASHRRGLAYGLRHGIAIVVAPLGVQLVALLFDPMTGFSRLLLVLAALVAVMLFAALLLPAERRAGVATA